MEKLLMNHWTEMWIILEQKKVQERRQYFTGIFIIHIFHLAMEIYLASFHVNSGVRLWQSQTAGLLVFFFSNHNHWLDSQISVLSAVKHNFHLNDKFTPAQIFSSLHINNVCLCLVCDHDLDGTRGRPLCASVHGSNDGKTSLSGWTPAWASVFLQGLSQKLVQAGDHRTRVFVQASRDHGVVVYLVRKKCHLVLNYK